MWPAVKRGFTQEQFRDYLSTIAWGSWRPNKIVWHNTAAPTLAQWAATAESDVAKGLKPGTTRIGNLERYFWKDNGWSGCPHLFIAPDFIWVMNPLTHPGVHSPSWNSSSIGIEMIGDYSCEDFDSGPGLAVKNNTVFATALLLERFGLDPENGIAHPNRTTSGVIFLHKQDWRTTHDCPGKGAAIDKVEMIGLVQSLMTGGDHPQDTDHDIRQGIVEVDDLQVRTGPGVANKSIGVLNKDEVVTITNEARNGSTGWFQIEAADGLRGWSAARYIEEA